MPIHRQVLASDGSNVVEQVSAESHGAAWGVPHEATEWRCVLPGEGLVSWRSGADVIHVDALTAFRFDPGDIYQLRHERARRHHVLASSAGRPAPSAHRAWLLHPRDLFRIQGALARLRRGEAQDLGEVAEAARKSLERSVPLRSAPSHAVAFDARRCAASTAFDPIKIEELAEEVRCSPFHLTRLFAQHFGCTPHQYRLRLRLAVALQRLGQRETRLADLAFELGFSSQSHFTETFRRAIGCTPGQARIALR